MVTKWGSAGSGDGQFNGPKDVAVDENGNVFVADRGNNRIQKFTNTGTFLLTFGWGVQDGMAAFETCTSGCQAGIAGSGDGQFSGDGEFDDPFGIGVDSSGNVFVVERANNRIQKFTNTGTFLTKWGSSGSGDGQFFSAGDTAVDGNGNVFVTDLGNNRIQEFTNTGAFVRTWGCMGSGDGTFGNFPFGIAVDGNEQVFVADSGNNRIQKFGCP